MPMRAAPNGPSSDTRSIDGGAAVEVDDVSNVAGISVQRRSPARADNGEVHREVCRTKAVRRYT